jgi:hypothetical protein
MRKRLAIFGLAFFCFKLIVLSQTIQTSDSMANNLKAKYLKGDLTALLAKNANYPTDQLQSNIGGSGEGDVILSLSIHKDGKSEFLKIVSSPNISFATNSLVALNKLDDAWSPARLNNEPIDKNYFIVFRYRKYLDIQPIDYKGRIEKSLSKQKYKEALRLLNNAINDNKYDGKLFESRSKVKQSLGDTEGAKFDELTANKLDDEILSLVIVQVFGRTTKRVIGPVAYP